MLTILKNHSFIKASGCIFLLLSLLGNQSLYAQSGKLWSEVPESSLSAKGPRDIVPQKYRTLTLSEKQLRQVLTNVPSEAKTALRNAANVITLPLPNGTLARFRFVEAPVLAPELAARFPQIKTYAAQGIDDPSLSARFDYTPNGFHAMIHSPQDGLSFIDPYSKGSLNSYIAYAKKEYLAGSQKTFTEEKVEGANSTIAKEIAAAVTKIREQRASNAAARPSGDQLRTYRVAIAATGEYTAFHGGTVAAALSGITTTLNRVNFIYIREVAIRMLLVANNTSIIYTNAATDPYSNGSPGSMITQNQTTVDAVIGSANYDIGHVFGTNSGGLAGLGVVCRAGLKARGVTGSGAPIGDAFDVDYVAHEMGHQFGANHTFNGSSGSCVGNANTSTAFEPGSGSTIMAYAGICSPQNLQPNSDAYFHTASYDEIFAYSELGLGNGCAVISSPANTAPVPTIVTTSGLTIPRSTPFTITGSATDFHNDPITYCWEQYDLGPAGHPDSPVGNAPLFRSFTGTSVPSRTFPKLSDLLNNVHTIGEILPSYARSMRFSLTVRDNYAGGGGVDWAYPLVVNVSGTAGPFLVTNPNAAVSWVVGSTQTITWSIAGTNVAPINATNVKISLSTNGGLTFPTVLLASTPNDGAQSIVIPNFVTNTARIKIEAVGNIFFDISNTNFQIKANTAPTAAWNKRFGGSVDDYLRAMIRTSDGGYLLGGTSLSTVSGDRTEATRGAKDYWIVKTNSVGTKLWDKRFGGTSDDFLNTITPTTDGGYLLGGISLSGVGGDKTQGSRGSTDFWVVKINSVGTKVWDKRFGGTLDEELHSVTTTLDGGYILAGFSSSGIGGDKTEASRGGKDFWIVKINNVGVKVWDKRFGGTSDEQVESIIRNSDGTFLLSGYSSSGISGDKTQTSQGLGDFWIVRVTSAGAYIWDKRFGGTGIDQIFNAVQTSDGGFLLAGGSTSGLGGDKTQASRGGSDYWVVRTNSVGTKLWDRRFGGTLNDQAAAMIKTSDNGFVLAGWSASGAGADKTEASRGSDDYWMLKINGSGTKLWDKRFGSTLREEVSNLTLLQNPDNSYVIGGLSNSGIGGDKSEASRGGFDYWIVKTNVAGARLGSDDELLASDSDAKKALFPSDDADQLSTYPTPFTDKMTIQVQFKGKQATTALLEIFDVNNKLVERIQPSSDEAGAYVLEYDARNLPSGMYIVRLTTPHGVTTKKIIRMR